MNAYDFDKTIYPGDSASHFWRFIVRRHPAAALRAVSALGPALRAVGGDLSRGELKQGLFAVLRGVEDPVKEAEIFWDSHIERIYPWYLGRKRDDDLIISASPDFLIAEACRRLGIAHMATNIDPATGHLLGPNCWGEEKVRRFKAEYGETHIEEFYSDSLSDLPMMALAERGYLVKNGTVVRQVDPASPGGRVPKK